MVWNNKHKVDTAIIVSWRQNSQDHHGNKHTSYPTLTEQIKKQNLACPVVALMWLQCMLQCYVAFYHIMWNQWILFQHAFQTTLLNPAQARRISESIYVVRAAPCLHHSKGSPTQPCCPEAVDAKGIDRTFLNASGRLVCICYNSLIWAFTEGHQPWADFVWRKKFLPNRQHQLFSNINHSESEKKKSFSWLVRKKSHIAYI